MPIALLLTLLLAAQPARPPVAKNVILFVGDGMGVATVTAARIREGQLRGQTGEENSLSFERFPHVALVKTYSVDQQVAESAATMTAIVTGVKTIAGALSVDAAGRPQKTLLEIAEERGLSTGVVTTTRLTHATPAACYAHAAHRSSEPDIARQLIEFPIGNGVEVALGGGRDLFPAPLLEGWITRRPKSVYVAGRAQLNAIDLKNVDRILGLFAPSHMTFENERTASEPSLSEMTAKAIDLLSRNKRGYFLMVEGGKIDHAHHGGNAFHALSETIELARAVDIARRRTREDDTLIVVTADHSHVMTMSGYPVRGNPILGKVVELVPGGAPRIARDSKGLPYTTLGYANGPGHRAVGRADLTTVDTTAPDFKQESTVPLDDETHGGEDVAAYASGPGSERMRGVIEQNLIFDIIMKAAGWSVRK